MTAPGEKPLASKDTWDCYLNFSDETSKFYIPPALLYSTTPSEYHSNAIYQAMGVPSSWLQGGTQHLLQSALFMKPDEFPEAPWVLLPNSAKQSVLKGYNEGVPPVERRDEPPLRNDQPLRDDPPPRREELRPRRDDRGPDDYDRHYDRHDDQAHDDNRGTGTEGKTLTFRDVQALPNYNGKRSGPRVNNYLSDFQAALRLLSKRTLPTPGAKWGLLLKSKLEGDARIAIDALQASLNRVPTFQEMHDALCRQFAFSYEDVHSLTSKLEKLSWDGSWTLGDYLTRFWSLSLRIADKRSNMDLVKTLTKALPRCIINQLEGQFSTQEDPRLDDIIEFLKRTSWVNQLRESRGSQPVTRGRFTDFGRRGRDSRGRARGRFAGYKRSYDDRYSSHGQNLPRYTYHREGYRNDSRGVRINEFRRDNDRDRSQENLRVGRN
eukprot:jgi/Botrbrau1/18118/Bobra.0757s0001.2